MPVAAPWPSVTSVPVTEQEFPNGDSASTVNGPATPPAVTVVGPSRTSIVVQTGGLTVMVVLALVSGAPEVRDAVSRMPVSG